MPKSNYSRFADGVQISGVSLNVNQKGVVWYVCNSTIAARTGIVGSDGSDGMTPERPLATLAKAISLSVANRGDVIILLPGHAETVSAAAGIAISKAGITIVGVGTGTLRPTFTLDTANTATITVTANDIAIQNVLFVANFLNIAVCLDVTTAKGVKLTAVEFFDTSAILNFVIAVRLSATTNANDQFEIREAIYSNLGTTAATTLVNARGIIDRMVVADNRVYLTGTTATSGALVLATSKALTNALIINNTVACVLTTTVAGALIVAGTGGNGFVRDNDLQIGASVTPLLCTASSGLAFANNTISTVADLSGYILPAQDS